MPPMPVHIESARVHMLPCRTRLPFRFGIHTLTDVPLCELALKVSTPSGTVTGRSSDFLMPRWFRKDESTSPVDDSLELLDSVESAVAAARTSRASTVFDVWQDVHGDQVDSLALDDPSILVRGFGVAMVERALMDAVSRAADVSFADAWDDDLFGFDAAAIHDDLSGWRFVPSRHNTIDLRHTVGLVDAIRRDDVADRIDDGLPECLEEDIMASGVRWFKLKIGGDPDQDLTRLGRIASLIADQVGTEARFTLDGNEQYGDVPALLGMLEHLPDFLRGRVVSIEQPVPRRLTAEVDVSALTAHAPVILDEADSDPHAFRRSVSLGYTGVSVKNCKGVFQAVANRGLCEVLGGGLFQSGEDLTNVACIPLQQDLATMSVLGLTHVERNGHHYFRGLDHLGSAVARELLRSSPDLYTDEGSCPQVRVTDGRLSIESLHATGFGGVLASIESTALDAAHWRAHHVESQA